ncbi:MAG: sugar ABC transporter substrate-binding protein [Acidimicrobiales bacterium]|jgi:ABC-type sugar transport system substrate-binding protein
MKTWLKKAVVLVAAAGIVVPLLAVGSASGTTPAAKPIKVGVALSYNNTAFWSAYVSYEAQFAKSMGVKLIGPLVCCDTYGSNATLQNQQVKDLVNEGAQAIILNPEDASAEGPSIAYAYAHHVPIISVDTILGAGKDYIVVRASNLFYGYSACSFIASKVKSGYVIDNEGQQVSSNGHDRAVGFNDCMAKLDPKVHVLSKDTLWNPNTALSFTETAVSAYGSQVKAVYNEYSGPDPGIIQYLSAKGFGPAGGTKPHVIVGGDDGVSYEQCYILHGWMDFASSQPANLYAEGAIKYAVDAAKGVVLSVGMPGLTAAPLSHVSYKGDVQLTDPIIAPFVTKARLTVKGPATDGQPATFTTTAVNNSALWGNVYGKAHGGICNGVKPL